MYAGLGIFYYFKELNKCLYFGIDVDNYVQLIQETHSGFLDLKHTYSMCYCGLPLNRLVPIK